MAMQIFTTPLVAPGGGSNTFNHGLSGKPDQVYAVFVASNGQLAGSAGGHVIENQNDEISLWDACEFNGSLIVLFNLVVTATQVIVNSQFWNAANAAHDIFWVQNVNAADDQPTAATIPNTNIKVYCIKF